MLRHLNDAMAATDQPAGDDDDKTVYTLTDLLLHGLTGPGSLSVVSQLHTQPAPNAQPAENARAYPWPE
jgi:hypothetical protein